MQDFRGMMTVVITEIIAYFNSFPRNFILILFFLVLDETKSLGPGYVMTWEERKINIWKTLTQMSGLSNCEALRMVYI